MGLANLSDRQRRIGQWLVGLFFALSAFTSLTGGEGTMGIVRGVLSAVIFLTLAGLSIPPMRARIFEATGRYYAPGKLVFLIVVGMLVGVMIAPPP